MGNSEIMNMDRGIVDAGARDEAALPGIRSGLLNRRSFLLGSAVGLGALGLAGCATDFMSRADAEKLYGPMPDEKFPIPAVDVPFLRATKRRLMRSFGSGGSRMVKPAASIIRPKVAAEKC